MSRSNYKVQNELENLKNGNRKHINSHSDRLGNRVLREKELYTGRGEKR
jgi:hypothetical protein